MKRKWEEKLKKIGERASQYERKPLGSVYRPRLSKPEDPSSVWKLFHRQAQAFSFVRTCKEDVHVFALEHKVGDGQRIYLVTTYPQLWFYYKSRKNLMHCYEVIPEDAVCKLYFDLEFSKPANPAADGKKMVSLLIEHVSTALQELFNVNCSAENVLNLDSSTDEKFSRHLIFQLRNVAFKNNVHVGNFVRKILQPVIALDDSKINEKIPGRGFSSSSKTIMKPETSFTNVFEDKNATKSQPFNSSKVEDLGTSEQNGPDLSFLIVKNKGGDDHLFVDVGVYTRNRNFRLYKSSKLGKYVPLEVAEDNKFLPKQSETVSEENQYFLSSLVTNIRFSDTLRILTCDVPLSKQKRTESFNSACTKVGVMEGFQCSPYPEIDNFVLSVVNKNGVKGGIRCWNYFFPEELLVYDISKYRWCGNIKRAHKSNNIMILVDLKNEVWYQKCHDPVCRAENFKSDYFPLPTEVCLLYLFKEDDEDHSLNETETRNIETNPKSSNPQELSFSTMTREVPSDADWDNGIDDTCFLEAVEDAELAEAAEKSLASDGPIGDEIPDALIMEMLEEENTNRSVT
ncbi:DNA-directed primase/polymerase protein [Dromiciops gliroides]|uniref:DNA-directed primase/polymerase protein n=1 Tax=Dromiciops gliroides TaxID=33562 RepID=UPI001CC4E042|nr:DNA-directed primase/polymerase protein [Dromiciops gliroides]XP_043827301.1 DNA-directed primase/polymerase protein [Dromiciops gliroides]XP_043827302.1 DNA-directed primase/polymerase protein [Dromiciops gliroides]